MLNIQGESQADPFAVNNNDAWMQGLFTKNHDNTGTPGISSITTSQGAIEEQISWLSQHDTDNAMSTPHPPDLTIVPSTRGVQPSWASQRPQEILMAGFECERIHLRDQFSHTWSHQYQMGTPVYRSVLANVQQSGRSIPLTNSGFSDHLNAIKDCFGPLRYSQDLMTSDYARYVSIEPPTAFIADESRFFKSVSVTLSLFNSLARPEVLGWYAPTKYYQHIAGVVMWQIRPCRDTYDRLATRYRPTALQMMERYPAIIDWCPFASVRDRLITCHAANPRIDEIICNMATSYVVEADLRDLVQINGHSLKCYIRVWDIIQSMDRKASDEQHTAQPKGHLPAPTAASLFTKPYASQVFQKLHMDEGITFYKLDPAFFMQYPELIGDDH
ncbi:unnamed protein product [Aureobasidium uvarum]|uniref:Uncharacterized protein n=1 Tax=Aureobasidium uvarum TaxID=2773716 RepID=A0A9N8PSS5_9PEZI|nr:unnamed protein product [Aureobasidium uvarum]